MTRRRVVADVLTALGVLAVVASVAWSALDSGPLAAPATPLRFVALAGLLLLFTGMVLRPAATDRTT